MLTIYVDLDGVIADFYGATEPHVRDPELWYGSMFREFILSNGFATLKMLPHAGKLINFLNCLRCRKVILSSAGGIADLYDEVARQKVQFLKDNQIDWGYIITPTWREKAQYAGSATVLIDDSRRNVEDFIRHGGNGILYQTLCPDSSNERVASEIGRLLIS